MAKPIRCGDCGVKEGQIHHPWCDMEPCPFCGGQLLYCLCPYEQLKLIPSVAKVDPLSLPPLSKAQRQRWRQILHRKERVPFILYPVLCEVCGEMWPDFFKVPNEEWMQYIPPDRRRWVICRSCYDRIKATVDRGEQFEYPQVCHRCGQVNPPLVAAHDKEWQRLVPLRHQQDTLCQSCFDVIKTLIEQGRLNRKITPP